MLTGDRPAPGTGRGAPSRWARPGRRGGRHRAGGEARLLILDGDVEQGLALLDEAGVATVSGEPRSAVDGRRLLRARVRAAGLAQYDMAEEWTEAMERWCETNAIGSLHGRCRVHRAEILRLRGSCNEAEGRR